MSSRIILESDIKKIATFVRNKKYIRKIFLFECIHMRIKNIHKKLLEDDVFLKSSQEE